MATTYKELRKLVAFNEQKADLALLDRAWAMAESVYGDKTAAHKRDMLQHCLDVAAVLVELRADFQTVVGGLLHEFYMHSPNMVKLENELGHDIAEMVRLLYSVNVVNYSLEENTEEQADYIRRMFMALAKDVRVVLVKLAGRLDVMRNIGRDIPKPARDKLAKETLQVYAPLAHRLGISQLRSELEDLSFKTLLPVEYAQLKKLARAREKQRKAALDGVIGTLKRIFKDAGLGVHITGRTKHLYSTYRKMLRQNKDFSELFDHTAVRVIVEHEDECYHALSILHNIWKPVPDTFDNYIVNPKPNGYQSIHTVVEEPGGEHVEVQIRTWDMHAKSEYGVASHYMYKEADGAAVVAQPDMLIQRISNREDDPYEFLKNVVIDVQEERVFTFSPKGRVFSLPRGATPIDFAFRIHTQVGYTCSGAKVNGIIVPLNHELKNGDVVEVITRKRGHPSRDWLNYVKSSNARSKIRQWFRKANREENVVHGKSMVERELHRHGLRSRDAMEKVGYEAVAVMMNFKSADDMFAAVGCGDLTSESVANRLRREYKKAVTATEAATPRTHSVLKRRARPNILVKGMSGMLINVARCCLPVPGDDIVGFVSRGRGLTIHRRKCSNIRNEMEKGERIVDVTWSEEKERLYITEIEVRTLDRTGLLNDITSIISAAGLNVVEFNSKSFHDSTAFLKIKLEVADNAALRGALSRIRQIEDVISANRLGAS